MTPATTSPSNLCVLAPLRDKQILTQRRKEKQRQTGAAYQHDPCQSRRTSGNHSMTPATVSPSNLCVLASLRDKQILTQRRKVAKKNSVRQAPLTSTIPVKADEPQEITP